MDRNGSEQAQDAEIFVIKRRGVSQKASNSYLRVLQEAWHHFAHYRVFPGLLECASRLFMERRPSSVILDHL